MSLIFLTRLQNLHIFKTSFQLWKTCAATRSSRRLRALRAQFFCFQDWKSLCATAKTDAIAALKRGSDARLKDAQSSIKELEREVVLLKSKVAEASASSALMRSSRPEHLQQLHVSRAAELSAIHRAQHAEDLLAAAQLQNELLNEQFQALRETINHKSSSETSMLLKLQEAEELNARLLKDNRNLLEENSRLRENLELEVCEKKDLAAHAASLSAALKQQVAMMMKRAAAAPHRS
jgi:hypothetical protein